MKKLLAILGAVCLCGCATINDRVLNNCDITDTYQCTQEGIAFCTFVTVPQIMMCDKGQFQWDAMNIFTVPVGVCCFVVDIPLEFVFDTLCWPYDKYRLYHKQTKNKKDLSVP